MRDDHIRKADWPCVSKVCGESPTLQDPDFIRVQRRHSRSDPSRVGVPGLPLGPRRLDPAISVAPLEPHQCFQFVFGVACLVIVV